MSAKIQRRFKRWQINWQIKLKLNDAPNFVNAQVMDIGYMGMRLVLSQKLPEDKLLRLVVALSDAFVLNVEAWVIWHKIIDGYSDYGLYFTGIKDTDKEKIYLFIQQYFPEELNKQWWDFANFKKGGEEMEDRRIFARFKAELPLRFLSPKENAEGMAKTVDVSAKGIGFVTDKELKARSPLEMWLEASDKGEPIYVRGEVVWSKRMEPNKFRVGVSLEKADFMGLARILMQK
jgi:hypothetical protein